MKILSIWLRATMFVIYLMIYGPRIARETDKILKQELKDDNPTKLSEHTSL